jgi:DNA-binding NtrC family response regulator
MLVIDDDPISLEIVKALVAKLPIAVLTATDAEQGLALVRAMRPHILLVDYLMPRMDGMEVIERALEIDPDLFAMLMTAHYSTESAVGAIERGACDCFEKPISPERLYGRVEDILKELRERQTAESIEAELVNAARFEGMIGRSPEMMAVFSKVRHVAPHFRTALVTGPTGTGKELVAHALHNQSPAPNAPFAILNCSAVVETLFESELFGHVKGSFTGAVQDKVGVFEYANGGTVFLDEIGELPLSMQAKLLRVLQQQEVQRVGSPQPRKVNVRIVAATNRDLREMVKARQFREDLFYRLSMVEIKIPSLHRRGDDIPLLLRFMINKYSNLYNKPVHKMTLRCQQLLQRYEWPGNVREMENVIGSACMMAQGSVLDTTDLPEEIREQFSQLAHKNDHQSNGKSNFDFPQEIIPLYEMEKRYVRYTLEKLKGNKLRTAEALGIGRATLYRLLANEKPAASPVVPEKAMARSTVQ